MLDWRSDDRLGMLLVLRPAALVHISRLRKNLCYLLFVATFCLVCGNADEANAAPETWFNSIQTITGNASSGFGSAVACSTSVSGLNHSYIAVGAPQENSGEGRVYIVGPAGLIKTILPPALGGTGNFGYAVTFITDMNGDAIDELAIGEPDSDGGPNGSVHMYLSTGVAADPYMHCGSRTGPPSFGSTIFQTSDIVSPASFIIVSTTEGSPALSAYTVTESMSVCTFTPSSDYQGGGSGSSRYGQTIGEIDTGGPPGNDLLVGAPGQTTDAGTVFSKPFSPGVTARYSGSTTEQFGVALASLPASPLFAFNAPYASSGDTVYVKHQSGGSYSDYCSLHIPMGDLSETAGRSLLHISNVFDDFVAAIGGASFASYRTEATTGGSVALFGAAGSMCTAAKQVNNCVLDAGQRQGEALAGGPTCVTTGGTKILVVGAPGFSSNTGRVDIYAEGSESGSVVPCTAPTNTPTPTFTPTPERSPTTEPTATPGVVTPIPVGPRTSGLPAPEATLSKKTVTLVAPALRAANRKFRFIGYLFLVVRSSTRASVGSLDTEGAPLAALSATRRKKREIFSKRNRITLRNLGSGTYTASYRPVFTQGTGRAAKRVLGRFSAKRVFRVG